jgi:hypothetical protein
MIVRDALILIIARLFDDQKTIFKLHDQMALRHKNRQRDINLFYKDLNDS